MGIIVVTPTYHCPLLPRAITSLQSQTFQDFECWVVKDGCDYDFSSCPLCQETENYMDGLQDPRFSFHKLPVNTAGKGHACRNYAILNTKHPLIAYLDDDNWLEPNHLELLVGAVAGKDMAYTGSKLWTPDGEFIKCRFYYGPPQQGSIDTSEIIHNRRLISLYGGWRNLPRGTDWDLVGRWVDFKWGHTNDITLNYLCKNHVSSKSK